MSLTLQEQLAGIKVELFKNQDDINDKHIDNKINNQDRINKLCGNYVHSNINEQVVMQNPQLNSNKIICHRGEVFYSNLLGNYGSEQGGIRPVVIIQNDVGNRYSPTVIVAVLTSKMSKAKLPTHLEVDAERFGLNKDSVILFEQIRTLDKRRLREKVCTLDELTMRKVDKALGISLGVKVAEHEVEKEKTLFDELSIEMKNYIINKLNLIEDCKKSLNVLYKFKGDKKSIDFFEDKIFEEENSLQYYCDKKNINYEEVYNDYIKSIIKRKEDIAL